MEEQELNQTGMALLEVGLLSGFTLAQDGVQTNNNTMKVEEEPGKVIVYLDSVRSGPSALHSYGEGGGRGYGHGCKG